MLFILRKGVASYLVDALKEREVDSRLCSWIWPLNVGLVYLYSEHSSHEYFVYSSICLFFHLRILL
jgi:hypothetical protein